MKLCCKQCGVDKTYRNGICLPCYTALTYGIERKLCGHCQARVVSRPRGLCVHCYNIPKIRATRVSKNAEHYIEKATKIDSTWVPTTALPGSEEKIAIMQKRFARRQPIFHPKDASYDIR